MQVEGNRDKNTLSVIETEFLNHFSDWNFVKKFIDLTTSQEELHRSLPQLFEVL